MQRKGAHMAAAIPCDFCGQRVANLLIGNLDNGQQIAVCYGDVPTACAQLTQIAAAVAPQPDPPAPDAPATAPEDNGAGAMPAPRPPEDQGETPAPAGTDSPSEAVEDQAATADAS